MTTIPFNAQLAEELHQREQFLEATRAERVRSAQALIQSCFPLTELRRINVLVPYYTFEGVRRYRKVPTWKEVRV